MDGFSEVNWLGISWFCFCLVGSLIRTWFTRCVFGKKSYIQRSLQSNIGAPSLFSA